MPEESISGRSEEKRKQENRCLCSDLLLLRTVGDWTGWVNLEEIWRTGAALESDVAIPEGLKVLIEKAGGKIWGAVVSCVGHDFGYRVEVEFLFDQIWTPEVFLPDHLLDPRALDPDALQTEQEQTEQEQKG